MAEGASTNGTLLEVRDLHTYFFSREGTLKAVDGVGFSLSPRTVLGVVGESGCGKSVTSQSILRIVPKNGRIVAGQILLHRNGGGETVDLASLEATGPEIRRIRGKEISMVFQEPMTSFSPVYTVGSQITEVIRLHQRTTRQEARQGGIEILDLVGMPDPSRNIDAYPFELSGGMRQRAMIAMALSCRPKLLIADEPTSALDVTVQAQILELLRRLEDELGMAVMLITHDLGVVAEMAQNLLIMYLGRSVEYGTARQVFHEPKHPYTRGLLKSIPKLGKRAKEELKPISGTVPSLHHLPRGCPFHPRCPDMMPGVCDAKVPGVTEVDTGHVVRCFLYSDVVEEQSVAVG
jgi:peptide/nickel transport system ATP-binding protein